MLLSQGGKATQTVLQQLWCVAGFVNNNLKQMMEFAGGTSVKVKVMFCSPGGTGLGVMEPKVPALIGSIEALAGTENGFVTERSRS
jgi:hypothetical protein